MKFICDWAAIKTYASGKTVQLSAEKILFGIHYVARCGVVVSHEFGVKRYKIGRGR